MKLDAEFLKLPLRFDAARLAEEAAQFDDREWRKHPEGHVGNSALALIAAGGDPNNDAVHGPMKPTPFLGRCPYLRQVLASMGAVWGRTRLMRIEGNGEAKAHVDTNYYWSQHVRVHVPLRTRPEVEFQCGGRTVHMAAGECWLFDTWRMHNVLNNNPEPRVHLVADTVGSAAFWDLAERAERPFVAASSSVAFVRHVPFEPNADQSLEFETSNFPVVMSPWEIECQLASLLEDVPVEAGEAGAALGCELRRFHRDWRALWARFGDAPTGDDAYKALLGSLSAKLTPLAGRVQLVNGIDAVEAVLQWVVRAAHNPILRGASVSSPAVVNPWAPREQQRPLENKSLDSRFLDPVFIVSAPRSGSTFLFETLARSPTFFTVGGESHDLFESIPSLRPENRGWESNALAAEDATVEVAAALRRNFLERLRDRDGSPAPLVQADVRLLEKTPKNALRIPFLLSVFPNAKFVFLHRDARENVSSILDAWRSGKFVTYPQLPGWNGPQWSMLLIPEWRALTGKSPAEIAAAQWAAANSAILDALAGVEADRWTTVSYADLVANPDKEARRLCAFAGVEWDGALPATLPLSRHTLTPPAKDKWKKNTAELAPVLPGLEQLEARIAVAATKAPAPAKPGRSSAPSEDPKSVHTSSLAALLGELGVSLLVSTYQAGKLFVVRADGQVINTHFRAFQSPMGLAHRGDRLALGTLNQVLEFQNQPEAGRKIEPVGRHDACWMPRRTHVTGDIRIHDVEYADDGLWAVNTRFSCLCTFDDRYSFVPRWRPPFVTALAPEDRCHLNGLAVVTGQPRFVTALGLTDVAGGWRTNKRNGGVLMEVPTGEVVLKGLSMPHSPRLYRDRLWILESGVGGVGTVDLARGSVEQIAQLPGFTRGIDFYGDYAFVGLSQVRESAVFAGLPLTERAEERHCGVWAVDLRTGKVAGFLRFDAGVQEIFSVAVLPSRWPEIVTDDAELINASFMLPDEALRDVPVCQRAA